MIEDIIKEIKNAESLADDMQKDAYQKAKDIMLSAELKADSLKKDAVKSCKDSQKEEIAKAEKEALENREAILHSGEIAALALKEAKEKLAEEKANEIVDALLNKYCKK